MLHFYYQSSSSSHQLHTISTWRSDDKIKGHFNNECEWEWELALLALIYKTTIHLKHICVQYTLLMLLYWKWIVDIKACFDFENRPIFSCLDEIVTLYINSVMGGSISALFLPPPTSFQLWWESPAIMREIENCTWAGLIHQSAFFIHGLSELKCVFYKFVKDLELV